MRRLIAIFTLLSASVIANASTCEWGASAYSHMYEQYGDVVFDVIGNIVKMPGAGVMSADGQMFGYFDGSTFLVKQYDRTTTPVGDENVTFVLAQFGELLAFDTMETAAKLPLCVWNSYDHDGGLAVGDPSDFYLGFVVPESKTTDGVIRYGWYHLSFEDGYDDIKLLDSGVGLYGENVLVGIGAVPEPTAAMLLLLGVAGLALRRKRER